MTARIRGEKHALAKLTRKQVLAMRRLRAKQKLSYAELGEMFHVSAQVAHGICRGDRWGHIGGPLAGPSKVGRRLKKKEKELKASSEKSLRKTKIERRAA